MLEIDRGPAALELHRSRATGQLRLSFLLLRDRSALRKLSSHFPELIPARSTHLHRLVKHLRRGLVAAGDTGPPRRCYDPLQITHLTKDLDP